MADSVTRVEEGDAAAAASQVEASWLGLGARLADGFEAAEGERLGRDSYHEST